MVNKLWYKDIDEEQLLIDRNHIQGFIDLYCFNNKQINLVEDIVTENLGEFLEIILRHYEQYHFHLGELIELGDSLTVYLHRAYIGEFPDNCFPVYHIGDKRNLALDMVSYIEIERIFPEDVSVLIDYLHTHDSEVVDARKKIEVYLSQFDPIKRNNEEYPKRWKAICEQRIEAIQNNKPLPIKPMGIELDPCYKK